MEMLKVMDLMMVVMIVMMDRTRLGYLVPVSLAVVLRSFWLWSCTADRVDLANTVPVRQIVMVTIITVIDWVTILFVMVITVRARNDRVMKHLSNVRMETHLVRTKVHHSCS